MHALAWQPAWHSVCTSTGRPPRYPVVPQGLLPVAAQQLGLMRGKGWWALAFVAALTLSSATYQVSTRESGGRRASALTRPSLPAMHGLLPLPLQTHGVSNPGAAEHTPGAWASQDAPPRRHEARLAPPLAPRAQLWWVRGAANANFFYGMGLAWGAWQALFGIQLVKLTAWLEGEEHKRQ